MNASKFCGSVINNEFVVVVVVVVAVVVVVVDVGVADEILSYFQRI